MATTPENKCKAKIRAMLDSASAWYCMPIGTGYGRSGIADFVGVHRGRAFGIEAKADTAVTALQTHNLDLIHKAGGHAFVVRLRSNGVQEGFSELELFLKGRV